MQSMFGLRIKADRKEAFEIPGIISNGIIQAACDVFPASDEPPAIAICAHHLQLAGDTARAIRQPDPFVNLTVSDPASYAAHAVAMLGPLAVAASFLPSIESKYRVLAMSMATVPLLAASTDTAIDLDDLGRLSHEAGKIGLRSFCDRERYRDNLSMTEGCFVGDFLGHGARAVASILDFHGVDFENLKTPPPPMPQGLKGVADTLAKYLWSKAKWTESVEVSLDDIAIYVFSLSDGDDLPKSTLPNRLSEIRSACKRQGIQVAVNKVREKDFVRIGRKI